MTGGRFRDRLEAGEHLARALAPLAAAGGRPVVLGLPRGGVVVAYQVAVDLGLELDVVVVRKLGLPGQPELAMGAIAAGGVTYLNQEVLRSARVSEAALRVVVEREAAELARRERLFRAGRPPLDVAGRTAILVDDGLATGATMRAAIAAMRAAAAGAVIAATPVGASSTCRELETLADEVVCVVRAGLFFAVGEWYEDFSEVTDEQVVGYLDRLRGGSAEPPRSGS